LHEVSRGPVDVTRASYQFLGTRRKAYRLSDSIIYLDNQATTRVDPRVVDAMASYWTERYGNAGSTHALGHQALQDVDRARGGIAESLGCRANELLFTSGATESNNLALLGALRRRQTRGKHLISVATEHHAILDPLKRLEREGYEVLTAKDGADALLQLQDHIPDAMLLDIEMPRMDGFEVAKNIRSSSRLKDIPIIMITSRTGDKHRERALSLGVNKYMGKPYQEDKLLHNIRVVTGDEEETPEAEDAPAEE